MADKYDITTERYSDDPHGMLAEMRRDDPIYPHTTPSGRTIWYVTRYELALVALKDRRLVMSYRNALTADEIAAAPPTPPFFDLLLQNVLNQDPPDHTRMRSLVSKAFTPRRVEALRPRIAEIADTLLDEVVDSCRMDLIDAFAFPLPIIVICEMLGVPAEDRDRFRSWSADLLFSADLEMDDSKLRRIAVAAREFEAYMRTLLDQRRAHPGPDLVTALLSAEDEGDRLSEPELISMLMLLLIAGHETTVNLIGNAVLTLLQHPAAWARLCSDPSLIPEAVEEILRFEGPVGTSTRRWVGEDMELGGQQLSRGDMVLVSVLSANRDPAAFDEPDRFDIDRGSRNRHLAFGHGIHYCLGAPLARLEGELALGALLRRLPALQLDAPAAELRWRPGNLLHGLWALPVRW